jgi:hypothetical protein
MKKYVLLVLMLVPLCGCPVPPTPPVPNNTPMPDFGVATFERFNNSLARITGVPISDPVVQTLYNSVQQSMPAGPLISAFLPSHQAAFSQLANAYCGELLTNPAYATQLNAFFPGLSVSLGGSAATFFNSGSNRQIVETGLVNNAVGISVLPATALAVTNEVDVLLQRVPTLNAAATVSIATQAACTATLASAAVTLQ